MNRLMQWVIAAALICGTTTFTSCTNEDNPVDPATNLSEMIIGKWITADIGGQAALTNAKMVTTFISTTKAIASSSKVDFTEKDSKWNVYREDDVVIAGNKVTLTGYPNEHTTLINEYDVSSITNTELIGTWKHITVVDGVETVNTQYDIRLVKGADDYRADIIGTWEGHCTSEGSEFDDGQEHRWQYNADGTYVYYVKDGDNERVLRRWHIALQPLDRSRTGEPRVVGNQHRRRQDELYCPAPERGRLHLYRHLRDEESRIRKM